MGDGRKAMADQEEECRLGNHDIRPDGVCFWCKKKVPSVKTDFKPQRLEVIALNDALTVAEKNRQYGESWCKRGGCQAFAVIWRKVDRIESIMGKMENGYDIFAAWEENPGNVIDDIVDLRQYLLLLEEYMTRPRIRLLDSGYPQAQGYVNQD